MDSPLRAQKTTVALAFFYNFSYLMFAFLVPLYAAYLGYSLAAIGLVAASPAAIQIPLRLASGPLADTWGERRLFALLFVCSALAGIIMNLPLGVLGALLVAQCFFGVGRGLYWNTIQSYFTRFPDTSGKWLGFYTSSTNAGAFCGIIVAGPISLLLGFHLAFLLTSTIQIVALVLALRLPLPPKTHGAPTSLSRAFTRLPGAMARRELWLASAVAILVALPPALAQSFWPVYLVKAGSSATVASIVVSLCNVAAMSAGLLAGPILVRLGRRQTFIIAAAVLLVGLSGAAWSASAAWVAGATVLSGIAQGVLNVLYVMLAGSASRASDHATGFAVVNFFFAATMLVTPLGFGVTAAAISTRWTFLLLGLAAVIVFGVAALRWEDWWSQRQSAGQGASLPT